jgi:Fe-S cluster biosynthesis and repair protein YggX
MTIKKAAPKPIDYQKLGRKGGKACFEKIGRHGMSKLAKDAWKKRKAMLKIAEKALAKDK